MAYKTINPDIWADCHFEEAKPFDKLIWFYLMTCPERGVSGIFKVTIKRISDNTGIERQVVKAALENDQVTNVAYDFVNGVAFLINGYRYRPPGGNPKIIRAAVMADYRKTQACIKHWEKFCNIYPLYDAEFLTLEQPMAKGSATVDHGLEKPFKNGGAPNGSSTLELPLNKDNPDNNNNNNKKKRARARGIEEAPAPRVNPDPEATKIWSECLKTIQEKILPENFNTWFTPIFAVTINLDKVVIAVPNRFYIECLQKHYGLIIKAALQRQGVTPTPKPEYICDLELSNT